MTNNVGEKTQKDKALFELVNERWSTTRISKSKLCKKIVSKASPPERETNVTRIFVQTFIWWDRNL